MSALTEKVDIIKRDLDDLANLLFTTGICEDTSALQKAIGHIYNKSDADTWEYKISDLKFKLDKFPHAMPQGADCLELYLSMYLKAYNETTQHQNPLIEMDFNIIIRGLNEAADDVLACWHFDKHVPADESEEAKFVHPEYHFTFGGRNMWGSALDFGATLILPSPRLLHPPFDGILGIDFILGNYIKKEKRNQITKLPEYHKILDRAQSRMWKPYYLSIANHWLQHSSDDECMDLKVLVPNLIKRSTNDSNAEVN